MYLSDDILNRHATRGEKFVVFMDNVFILPLSIAALRARNIAIVGTKQQRTAWPSSSL